MNSNKTLFWTCLLPNTWTRPSPGWAALKRAFDLSMYLQLGATITAEKTFYEAKYGYFDIEWMTLKILQSILFRSYAVENFQIFKMRCCTFLYLKGLTNCHMSKFEVWQQIFCGRTWKQIYLVNQCSSVPTQDFLWNLKLWHVAFCQPLEIQGCKALYK